MGGQCYADPLRLADSTLEAYLRPLVATPERKTLLHRYALGLARNILSGIGPALQASRAPVRVVWGMDDTIFLPHGADYLEHAFGNSRGVRRLEGSKLFWPEERPQIIAAEARALWEA